MNLIFDLLFFAFAFLAVRGARWAYVAFAMTILLRFPASVGFRMHPEVCYLTVNRELAVASLSNYPHMILFCIVFVVTAVHFHLSGWRSLGLAIGATVAMGAAMEIAQGLSGTHHCKAIDLTPDFIGALAGVAIVLLGGMVANSRLGFRKGHKGSIC